jgi:tetratricopeptide (TPR) repeat protein
MIRSWGLLATSLVAFVAAGDFSVATARPAEVVVVIRATDLRQDGKVVASLRPGDNFTVDHGAAEAEDAKTVTIVGGKPGTVDRADVLPLDEALEFFNQEIAKDPGSAAMHLARGRIWFRQDQLEKAIADYNECLRLAPTNSEAYAWRGWAVKRQGDNDRALADFNEAIRLNPGNAMAHRVRGATWAGKQQYAKALADYSESIRLDPLDADPLNHRAIMLAACPEDAYRNGQQAVADATRACELTGWRNPLYLANLGAAFAERGDFDEAIRWTQKAAELSPTEGAKRLLAQIEKFKLHQPVRHQWK